MAQLIAPIDPCPGDPNGAGFLCLEEAAGSQSPAGGAAKDAPPLEDEGIVARLHAAKKLFSAIRPAVFAQARAACNPYEALGSGPFVNRSALKLVNLDHALDLVATAQKNVARKRLEEKPGAGPLASSCPKDLFFADLCGAPGGFSEYLLRRGEEHGEATHGWGITLGASNGQGTPCAWHVPERRAATQATGLEGAADPSALSSFEICWGEDGTGDLYVAANLRHYAAAVRAGCPTPHGVAVVVADGGFESARSQWNQEELMAPLVAAETLAGLLVLAPGGR
jgi:cap1 methyltransferase